MSGSVWLAGRIVPQEDEDHVLVFNGIYETYALAFGTCTESLDFIAEVRLNEPIDYETMACYFPCQDGGLPA